MDDLLRKPHFRTDVFVVQQYNNILGCQRLFAESYLLSSNNEKVEKCTVSQAHAALYFSLLSLHRKSCQRVRKGE